MNDNEGNVIVALNQQKKRPTAAFSQAQGKLIYLPVEFLQSGRYQPRHVFTPESLQELADSITTQGIMQPIAVRPISEHSYEIIAGERRWRAAQKAGLDQVPCFVRELNDLEASAAALIENLQREDLSPIEEAKGYQRLLLEFSDDYNQTSLAKALGVQRTKVAKLLRLLYLPAEVQDFIAQKQLTETMGQELLRLPNEIDQFNFAHYAVKKHWRVKELSAEINKYLEGKKSNKISTSGSASGSNSDKGKTQDWIRHEQQCSTYIGQPIEINPLKKGFQLVVTTHNLDELQGILEKLGVPKGDEDRD